MCSYFTTLNRRQIGETQKEAPGCSSPPPLRQRLSAAHEVARLVRLGVLARVQPVPDVLAVVEGILARVLLKPLSAIGWSWALVGELPGINRRSVGRYHDVDELA